VAAHLYRTVLAYIQLHNAAEQRAWSGPTRTAIALELAAGPSQHGPCHVGQQRGKGLRRRDIGKLVEQLGVV